MFTFYSYDIQKKTFSSVSDIAQIPALMVAEGVVNWVDFFNPEENDYAILENVFGFHHLAVEDCRHFSLFPKMDEVDNYLFLVLHDIYIDGLELLNKSDDDQKYLYVKQNYDDDFEKFDLKISEVDMFITKNAVVTFHQKEIKAIERLRDKILHQNEYMKKGRDFLLHELLDTFIDSYLEVSYVWNEVIEILEEDVINESVKDIIGKIITLKRNHLLLRRTIIHEKDIIVKLMRMVSFSITRRAMLYLQDLHDHISRLYDDIEINREMLTTIFEAYLSTVSNRMNKVMMKLTVITTIFMPLTFIAGVYGMNFKNFPEIEWSYGYVYVWGVFIFVGVLSYFYFKRNEMI